MQLMRNRPPTTEEMLNLVGLIYGSATDPGKVPEVLQALNRCLDGTSALIQTRQGPSGTVLDLQVSDKAIAPQVNQEYVNRWQALDPRASLLASLPSGQVIRCHDNFDEQFVSTNAFYQDFLIPHGLRWTVAGRFDSADGTTTVVADLRSVDSPAFQQWAADTLRQLLPHFQRSASIRASLQRRTPGAMSASELLRLLPMPCLFTDQAGRCIEGNAAFHAALEPLALRLVVGRLRFVAPLLQSRWETALFETHTTAVGRVFPLTATDGRQWRTHLIPWRTVLPDGDAFDSKMILVVFDDRAGDAQPQPGAMALKARLTRAELEVLAGLLQGRPAKAIASQRGASVNTVRSQIMAILEKTGHNSQRELMASFGASVLPDSVEHSRSR